MPTERFEIEGKTIDFIDFGASKGGSIDFAQFFFGGTHGVGIDKNRKKVSKLRELGFTAMLGDINKVGLPKKSVRFVMISHFLEHLTGLTNVKQIIDRAKQTAQEFICIIGPNFDEDHYLKSMGLRFFWSHWEGHTCHLKTWELQEILHELGLFDYEFYVSGPVSTWQDSSLHSLDSPIDQFMYDPAIHPEKPCPIIDQVVFKEFYCFIRLKEIRKWQKYLKRLKIRRELQYYLPKPRKCHESEESHDLTKGSSMSEEHRRALSDLKQLMLTSRGLDLFYHQHLRYALFQVPTTTVLVDSVPRGLEVLSLATEFPEISFLWCSGNANKLTKGHSTIQMTLSNYIKIWYCLK